MPIKSGRLAYYAIKKLVIHFCTDIDATKTAFLTGINRNTVNRYYKLFRELIYARQQSDLEKFFGIVECDEAYFGSKRLRGVYMRQKRGRGTWKQPVFGIFERDGRVYTEIVPDSKLVTLRKAITGKISVESIVITDGWRGYNGLVDVGYDKHLRIDKSKYFSDGKGVHINGIESFWSFVKRRLQKFNGVKAYFNLHLKESEWRWKKTEDQLINELWTMLKYDKPSNAHKPG
jgi:transposase-like protein